MRGAVYYSFSRCDGTAYKRITYHQANMKMQGGFYQKPGAEWQLHQGRRKRPHPTQHHSRPYATWNSSPRFLVENAWRYYTSMIYCGKIDNFGRMRCDRTIIQRD
jgi:hypothetical protein